MEMKKILVIGIILLFIGVSVAPSINQSIVTASNDNEGKADLVIGKIRLFSGDAPSNVEGISCQIINNGDAPADGDIKVHMTIKRLIFGLQLYGYDDRNYDEVINPGDYDTFAFRKHPHTIGIFRFIFTVNSDKIIEESNYLNNRRTAIYLVISDNYIGGWWRLY